MVTLFLTGLARDGRDAMANVAELVVALLVVCENLGNSLNQGLANIVDFTFQQLPRTEGQRRRLMGKFWRDARPARPPPGEEGLPGGGDRRQGGQDQEGGGEDGGGGVIIRPS